jgi:hypothetical protein
MALLAPDFEDTRAEYAARTLGTTRDSYLKARGYPSMQPADIGAAAGGYSDEKNRVYINPNAAAPGQSLAHEMSHASDNAQLQHRQWLQKQQAAGYTLNPNQQRFVAGHLGANAGVSRTVKALSPSFARANADYGATPEEARAFGVGAFYNPRNTDYARQMPNHMNATMATEQAVMEDLANRALGVRR